MDRLGFFHAAQDARKATKEACGEDCETQAFTGGGGSASDECEGEDWRGDEEAAGNVLVGLCPGGNRDVVGFACAGCGQVSELFALGQTFQEVGGFCLVKGKGNEMRGLAMLAIPQAGLALGQGAVAFHAEGFAVAAC